MTTELKFTGIAGVGDMIRAHDFMPRPGVGPCYIEGKVLDDADTTMGCLSYKIEVTKCLWDGKDSEPAAAVMYVPHEVSFMEWDGRVERIAIAPATRMVNGILQEQASAQFMKALEAVADMQRTEPRKTIDLSNLKKWEN